MLRVAVVGGGPSGSCAAEVLAKAGIQTWLFERKLDNAKPCGGAIPLCMVSEFEIPEQIIDRKVRNMRMISPSNREVDIHLDNQAEYIGMCRREVLDDYLRNRAAKLGANLINGLVTKIDTGNQRQGPYTLTYSDYAAGDATGEAKSLEVDLIIGADGANSRVAKAMDAGDYNVAIAFQERIKLPPEEMKYYENLAEMYVGTDVSPDFYAWVFPKYDHVAVGTGTMQENQSLIKSLQVGIRERAKKRLLNGEVIKVEAHPIPEHPRPRRVVGRMALVGDAAGYVTKSSGEGIYFAAKSGRMCAEQVVKASSNGSKIPSEKDLKVYLKIWDKQYGATYKVLEILQNIFYRNDAAREAFVEMCDDKDVQKLTFDSYLYKRVVVMNPWQQLKLTLLTLGSVLRGHALAPQGYRPVPSAVRTEAVAEEMLAAGSIRGGINASKEKKAAAAEQALISSDAASPAAGADGQSTEQRQPVAVG